MTINANLGTRRLFCGCFEHGYVQGLGELIWEDHIVPTPGLCNIVSTSDNNNRALKSEDCGTSTTRMSLKGKFVNGLLEGCGLFTYDDGSYMV